MKHLLMYVLPLVAIVSSVHAHTDSIAAPRPYEYRGGELLLGQGFITSGPMFDGASVRNNSYYINHISTGVLFLKYRYHKSRKISYGLTLAYENAIGVWNEGHRYGTKRRLYLTYIGHFKQQYFTAAPEITLNYLNIRHGMVRIYGTLGMGISYRDEVDTYDDSCYRAHYYNGVNTLGSSMVLGNSHFQFNMYASPFGVHVGRKLGGFFEIGLGYRGLLNYGLTYKF